jgi:RNA polymerase sigma-70 factor (ECF subfamily)
MEFNEVYKDYKEYVYNVVNKKLRYNSEEIEDICQDVWIRIYRKLHQFDESKGVLQGWIYRITSNQVYFFFNKKKDCKEVNCLNTDYFDLLSSDVINYSEAFKGEKELIQKQKIELIKRKSSELATSAKEIFRLYHFEGLKHEEIAEVKGISISTSKSQLSYARKKMSKLKT